MEDTKTAQADGQQQRGVTETQLAPETTTVSELRAERDKLNKRLTKMVSEEVKDFEERTGVTPDYVSADLIAARQAYGRSKVVAVEIEVDVSL